jgi:hypothetical protein
LPKRLAESLAVFSAILFLSVLVFGLFLGVFTLMFPLMFLVAKLKKKAEYYENLRETAVIAQYQPPHNLSPAEVGYLYDMQCGKNEIVATLFSLEQRKIITINSDNSVQIIDKNIYDGLPEYEKIAIRFAGTDSELKDEPTKFPITIISANNTEKTITINLPTKNSLNAFTNAVRQTLKNKNIPTRSFWVTVWIRALIIALIISLLPLLSAGISGNMNGEYYGSWSLGSFVFAGFLTLFFGIILFPVYLAIGLSVVLVWSKLAGRYWLANKQTRKIWPEIEGFKKYIELVDIDNIQFESVDKENYRFRDTLPYAIVFGLDTKWQQIISKRRNTLTP